MTFFQEMILTLVDSKTIARVKTFSKGSETVLRFENMDSDYRLNKTSYGTINLETFIFQDAEVNRLQTTSISFFKPIGFYQVKSSLLSSSVDISILKEFETEFHTLKSKRLIEKNTTVKFLSLEENALVAAYTYDTFLKAKENKDAKYISNGMKCELFMTHDNEYPQFYVDDSYNVEGPIVAFHRNGNMPPIINYEQLCNQLRSMELLITLKPDKQ